MTRYDTTKSGRRALVIGGSLGGLFAGALLHRAGWDVHIYERTSESLSGRGAGIVTHPMLFAAMGRAGVTVDAHLGVDVTERLVFAQDGSIAGRTPFAQTVTSWSLLYALLSRALPPERYHTSANFVELETTPDSVTAIFDDGARETGDLLIGADGIRSNVRAQFLPDITPEYAGYVAWRGLAPESALQSGYHRLLFDRFSFCLPPGEQILGYPVAGPGENTDPAGRVFNFVWYRPADAETALADLLTDENGKQYQGGIPPQLIRTSVIEAMRTAGDALLPPPFRDAVACSEHPFLQPIFDLMSSEIVFDRVALIGDAAFVARPHVGMGVTKAAEDALSLTNALACCGSIDTALAKYRDDRAPKGCAVVERGRSLGAGISDTPDAPVDPVRYDRARTPEVVMRETATPVAA